QVVEINDSETSVCVRDAERPNKSIQCAFDRVFGRDSTQEDVFNGLEPALDTVVEGFNACVLAYGQTGSGKTHTLIGPNGGTRLPDDRTEWGIIPRAVQFLFDRLNLASEEDETFSYSVTCSFLQIYNENLVDLLLQDGGTAATSATLQIREEAGGERGRNRARGGGDAKYALRNRYTSADGSDVEGAATGVDGRARGVVGHHQNRPIPKPHGSRAIDNRRVFVNGLSSFRVGGAQDVLRYVNLGAANRRVRATQHNEASSRSHAVMQLTVEVKSGGGGGDDESRDGVVGSGHVTYRQAKLSLVDLAGSEKMDSGLHISKGHFKELRSINQSLSTLGNVVSALSEKGRTHVPYRDSKLTRLLQDSLGGNTRTTIIACVNPLAGQTHETINTLQFADRAKKVMVRIRANEVVDDRVLLARAQSEIKRLKRRLREALEGTLLGGSTEDDGERNDTITGTDVEVQGTGGAPEDTVRASKKVEDFGSGGSTTGRKGGTGVKHGEADSVVSSPTVVADNGQQHRRSASPSRTAATVAAAPVVPKFRRRQFGMDEGTRKGTGSENEAVEGTLSAEEVRAMIDINAAEAKVDATALLAMFHRELREGVVSGSFVKRDRGGGGDEGNRRGGRGAIEGREAVQERSDGREDSSDSNANPDELTNIDVFLDQSQRLEDLMFEAEGRERRRLQEERGRLASARAERLAAHDSSDADKEVATHVSSDDFEAPLHRDSLTMPPVLTTMPSPSNGHIGGQAAKAVGFYHRPHHQQPQRPPPPFDGALSRQHEHGRTATVQTTPPSAESAEPMVATTSHGSIRGEGDHARKGICWTEQRIGSTTTNALESLSGARAGRTVPATKPPLQRNRHGRTERTDSSPTPPSPSSLSRRDSHLATSLRQRPATSTGYPPTGTSRAKSRSRRIRQRAGVRMGRSRSPIRAGREAFAEPASPEKRRIDGQRGGRNTGDKTLPARLMAAASSNENATIELQQAAGNPRLSSAPSEIDQKLGRKVGGSEASGAGAIEEQTTNRILNYSVADLGLRLKVYSFRYDHYYECQVVGYDSRRRMHRCAYDATGERHWHDLANKRFEVSGQNGVKVRSTASAPPAP
ncbi:unnamed protein product, partial [Scytosiphon promiscuus]